MLACPGGGALASEKKQLAEACGKAQEKVLAAAENLKRRAETLAKCAEETGHEKNCYPAFANTKAAQETHESAILHLRQACNPGTTANFGGRETYRALCSFCHDDGQMRAPRRGDKKTWRRLASGSRARLYRNALRGSGHMPARKGSRGFTDAQIKAAVDYLVDSSR